MSGLPNDRETDVRQPADSREGMRCCVCGAVLTRQEWPNDPRDPGVCDPCSKGGEAA